MNPLQNRRVSISEVYIRVEENAFAYPLQSYSLEWLTHQIATLQQGLESESPNFEVVVMPLALLPSCDVLTENMIIITFLSDCLFNLEEHKLEIIKLSSENR